MDNYIENKIAFCAVCGTILVKQYPQKTITEEWYCPKCGKVVYAVNYIYDFK